MLQVLPANIICNLKKAHPLINKIESIQIKEFLNEYISKKKDNNYPNIESKNNKMFIKSLLSSLEFRKQNKNNLEKNSIIMCKQNYKKIGILKHNKKIIKENKLKRNLSYNVKESKNNLKEGFYIKSNKKILDYNNLPDTENILLKTFNKKNLSTNNFNTIEKNIFSIKDNNKGKNVDNKIKNSYFKKYLQKNKNKFIEESKNSKFPKIKEESPRKEYLKFLEKKSLSLRANFIMNNIQNCRGRKQELRLLYNPLNV